MPPDQLEPLPLPESPEAYFLPDPKAVHLPLAALEATRQRPQGIVNAFRFMRAAAAGTMAKRKPIEVEPISPFRWRVLDGNSTLAVAKLSGWKFIPCLIRQPQSASAPSCAP